MAEGHYEAFVIGQGEGIDVFGRFSLVDSALPIPNTIHTILLISSPIMSCELDSLKKRNSFYMVYILNKNLKDAQKIRMALQNIYGIGSSLSHQICDQLGFSQQTCVHHLTSFQIDQLIRVVHQYYFTGSELRRIILQDIKRLTDIGCYKGFRHALSLPVRGQRTKTNARSARKSSFKK